LSISSLARANARRASCSSGLLSARASSFWIRSRRADEEGYRYLRRITVEYRGEVAAHTTSPLTSAVLKGVLVDRATPAEPEAAGLAQ